jgi:putative component of membrane protein insertase Oxa1/YidC/SpoIIIJ protein YidD
MVSKPIHPGKYLAEQIREMENKCGILAWKERTMRDDPRVAGGLDVLSKSAASSQAETKHKATEPA